MLQERSRRRREREQAIAAETLCRDVYSSKYGRDADFKGQTVRAWLDVLRNIEKDAHALGRERAATRHHSVIEGDSTLRDKVTKWHAEVRTGLMVLRRELSERDRDLVNEWALRTLSYLRSCYKKAAQGRDDNARDLREKACAVIVSPSTMDK